MHTNLEAAGPPEVVRKKLFSVTLFLEGKKKKKKETFKPLVLQTLLSAHAAPEEGKKKHSVCQLGRCAHTLCVDHMVKRKKKKGKIISVCQLGRCTHTLCVGHMVQTFFVALGVSGCV
jgi:hypothetical protein